MLESIMGEAKRRRGAGLNGDIDRLIEQAAQEVWGQSIVRPIGVGTGAETPLRCHSTSREYVAQHGGELVHGFWVSPKAEKGEAAGKRFQFIYHTLVRQSDGQLVDPNYVPGKAKLFVEDPSRPYDYDQDIGWGDVYVHDVPFRCLYTEQSIPAWTMVWSRIVDEFYCYSVRPEHARRRCFDWENDHGSSKKAYEWVSSLGLNPNNAIDVGFATNLVIKGWLGPGELPVGDGFLPFKWELPAPITQRLRTSIRPTVHAG
jgi:hypothetical protein